MSPRRPHRIDVMAQSGFTLIGLMVLIVVINIGLAVALTSWSTIDKRARETELIWRGQQYMRAIACHRQETGAPPDQLEDLLESDCIRALYPDPMTRDGVWRVIRESDLQNRGSFAETAQGRNAAGILDALDRELGGARAGAGQAAISPGGRRGAAPGAPGLSAQGADMSESLRSAYERLRNLTERLSQDFAGSGDGIVGVVSRSRDEALRMYEGETTYDTWRFVAR
ncbi:MAG: type II secretion system protein [Acidobacteriota bacterium]|jgi:type II secretory pathway pseudopilin PulG